MKRIARAPCIGTAPIAVRRYSNVTLDFLRGVAAVNLKYFNPLGCLYSSAFPVRELSVHAIYVKPERYDID